VTVNGGITNTQGRSILGTGGVLNTRHEGPTKRPTEDFVVTSDEKNYKRNKPTGEAPMNNPNFGMGPSEKKA
jgi:hypothetical protein